MENATAVSLDIYREIFRYMLSKGVSRLRHNDSKDHACVLIEELLHYAESEILIFCRNLGPDVWGTPTVISALGDALGRKVKVKVLLQEDPEGGDGNRALALLRANGVEVRRTHNTEVKANFIVIDNKAYRLEKDVENRRGYACANDAENASGLASAFADLEGDSEPVADHHEAAK